MTYVIKYLVSISLLITSAISTQAVEIESVRLKHAILTNSAAQLEADGLGTSHYKVRAINKRLTYLDEVIKNHKNNREILILLEGTESEYMLGHERHGKTKSALSELLKAGWKIKNIVPAGTTKTVKGNTKEEKSEQVAYVWLTF